MVKERITKAYRVVTEHPVYRVVEKLEGAWSLVERIPSTAWGLLGWFTVPIGTGVAFVAIGILGWLEGNALLVAVIGTIVMFAGAVLMTRPRGLPPHAVARKNTVTVPSLGKISGDSPTYREPQTDEPSAVDLGSRIHSRVTWAGRRETDGSVSVRGPYCSRCLNPLGHRTRHGGRAIAYDTDDVSNSDGHLYCYTCATEHHFDYPATVGAVREEARKLFASPDHLNAPQPPSDQIKESEVNALAELIWRFGTIYDHATWEIEAFERLAGEHRSESMLESVTRTVTKQYQQVAADAQRYLASRRPVEAKLFDAESEAGRLDERIARKRDFLNNLVRRIQDG